MPQLGSGFLDLKGIIPHPLHQDSFPGTQTFLAVMSPIWKRQEWKILPLERKTSAMSFFSLAQWRESEFNLRGKHDVNSQLPLNGHLVKVDTSLKRTHGVGLCRTSVIYFISLQGGHPSKADSRSWWRACPP